MDKVARLPAGQRRELFSEAAARLGMTPAVVEKDFWVSWTLQRLFCAPALARVLMFKGGTSLSKAYGLIERFSASFAEVMAQLGALETEINGRSLNDHRPA
jgi:hypothetical protein